MLEDQIYTEEPCFPDYNDSILNLSNSILSYFGVKPEHSTLPVADQFLYRNHPHVVVILLDGLGMNVLEKHLSPQDFLRRHLITDYSSVFPPTTTASTTTFLSGKSPIEHGWLGWDLFFEQENKTVTCFTNNLQGTDQPAADYNIPYKYFSFETIIDKINKAGKAKASAVFPFKTQYSEAHSDLEDWSNAILNTCKTQDRTFTYAYWTNPDGTLHRNGLKSTTVHDVVQELNETLAILCEELKDSLIFITADHGHRDIRNVFLQEDYPEFTQMLERKVSLEPRAISFYVKPEFKEIFPEKFKKYFGNNYLLFSKQQVLDEKLFGPGIPHENSTGIGDFIAAGRSEYTLLWNKEEVQFKSHHAGLSKEEMNIPLIVFENKPKKTGLIIFYTIMAAIIGFVLMCLF